MDESTKETYLAFFSTIEDSLKMNLPEYIKLLLWYFGYDNPSSLILLEEKDIGQLEEFAKNDLFEFADENIVEIIYSSLYSKNVQERIKQRKFKILPGHKKLMLAFVKTISENAKTLKDAFHQNKNGSSKSNCTCSCSCEAQRKKIKFGHNENPGGNTQENQSSHLNNKGNEKERTINHVKNMLKRYCKTLVLSHVSIHQEKAKLLEKIENIKLSYEGPDLFVVNCFVDNCSTACRITSRPLKNGGVNWVTSNFNRHLSKVHFKSPKKNPISDGETHCVKQRDIRSFNFKMKNKTSISSAAAHSDAKSRRDLVNSSLVNIYNMQGDTSDVSCLSLSDTHGLDINSKKLEGKHNNPRNNRNIVYEHQKSFNDAEMQNDLDSTSTSNIVDQPYEHQTSFNVAEMQNDLDSTSASNILDPSYEHQTSINDAEMQNDLDSTSASNILDPSYEHQTSFDDAEMQNDLDSTSASNILDPSYHQTSFNDAEMQNDLDSTSASNILDPSYNHQTSFNDAEMQNDLDSTSASNNLDPSYDSLISTHSGINNEIEKNTNNEINNLADNIPVLLQPRLQLDASSFTSGLNSCVNPNSTSFFGKSGSVDNNSVDTNESYFDSEFASFESVYPKNTPANDDNLTLTTRNVKWKENKYSRSQRKLRAIDQFNNHQLKLTEFENFTITLRSNIENMISEMSKHVNESATLGNNDMLEESANKECSEKQLNLLKMLLDNYQQNYEKSKFSNNFNFYVKQTALFIFINGGRYLYEILYSNMRGALPSLSTLYRLLDQTKKLEECQLRFEQLVDFLNKRNLPLKIFVSEDQTAVTKRVQYDPRTNKMVGFVAPINSSTGLPEKNTNVVNSVKDIENAFKSQSLAQNSLVLIAQALDDTAPPFCLGLFGSDNKFSSEDVITRWKHLQKEAKRVGISIEGFATDGDTRCLKSMKILTQLGCKNDFNNIYSPYFQIHFDLDLPVYIQDTVHICTKLKTRLTKPKVLLPMGSFQASILPIEKLIQEVSKDKHLLSPSYLDNTDKMNFKSIDKLCSIEVTDLLKTIQGGEATRQYLLLCRNLINVFLNKSLSVNDRVYYIWYNIFFLRLWRQWLSENKYSINENFISSNAYTCIELNGHGILLLIEKCRQNNTPQLFLPWLYSSQPCESTFRQIRSMTTTNSTIVNFSIYDMMKRLNRVQVLNDFSTDFREKMHFPREEGRQGSSNFVSVNAFPDSTEILGIIEKAKDKAIIDFNTLGMKLHENKYNEALEKVIIQPAQLIQELSEVSVEDENEKGEDNNQEINMSDSELVEIEEDLTVFSTYSNLNFKDYSEENSRIRQKSITKNVNSPYLKILLNDKKLITVRKSSLCWFFSDKQGHLSTDRILRVRGMRSCKSTGSYPTTKAKKINNKTKTKIRKCPIKKKLTKKPSIVPSESSTDDSDNDSFSEMSETLSESFSDLAENEEWDVSNDLTKELTIEVENYYSIFYDHKWYIGRILHIEQNSVKVKFLEEFLGTYKWPNKDDIQTVDKKFILHGPIKFGAYPFHVSRSEYLQINKKFRDFKK